MKFNNLYCFEYKDMYNIYNKIKLINKYYKLYFNTKDKTYIIVNTANFYEICLKLSNLSINVENLLNYSSVKNFNTFINYIEDSNKNTIDKQTENFKNKTLTACNECMNLLKKTSKISKRDIYKIIGEAND